MVFDADQDRDVSQLSLDDQVVSQCHKVLQGGDHLMQDFLGSADFKLTDLVTDAEGKVELQLLDEYDDPMSNSKVTRFSLIK